MSLAYCAEHELDARVPKRSTVGAMIRILTLICQSADQSERKPEHPDARSPIGSDLKNEPRCVHEGDQASPAESEIRLQEKLSLPSNCNVLESRNEFDFHHVTGCAVALQTGPSRERRAAVISVLGKVPCQQVSRVKPRKLGRSAHHY